MGHQGGLCPSGFSAEYANALVNVHMHAIIYRSNSFVITTKERNCKRLTF